MKTYYQITYTNENNKLWGMYFEQRSTAEKFLADILGEYYNDDRKLFRIVEVPAELAEDYKGVHESVLNRFRKGE